MAIPQFCYILFNIKIFGAVIPPEIICCTIQRLSHH